MAGIEAWREAVSRVVGNLQRLATLNFTLVWPCGYSLQKCRKSDKNVKNFLLSSSQQLAKKVNNIETGWALGATFHLLQSLGISY